METRLPSSPRHSTRYRERDGSDNRSLLYAFVAFSLATFIFVSYMGIDNYLERRELQNNIEQMEKQLAELTPQNAEDSDKVKLYKKLNEMIARQRMCDPTSATLNQIGSISDGSEKSENEILSIWNQSPKPFLHLTASEPFTKTDQENLDRMETVTGWEHTGGGECGSDPYRNGSDIVIPRDGNYIVYSQLIFHCKSKNDRPVIHRHVVQYIEVFGKIRHSPRLLMENAYQMCSANDKKKTRTSYQSGIYRFTTNDILRVVVKKGTCLHAKKDDVNKASFGVYSL